MRQDVSGWTTRLTDDLIADNTKSGIWRNLTLADQLNDLRARNADRALCVEGDRRLTVAEIDR